MSQLCLTQCYAANGVDSGCNVVTKIESSASSVHVQYLYTYVRLQQCTLYNAMVLTPCWTSLKMHGLTGLANRALAVYLYSATTVTADANLAEHMNILVRYASCCDL